APPFAPTSAAAFDLGTKGRPYRAGHRPRWWGAFAPSRPDEKKSEKLPDGCAETGPPCALGNRDFTTGSKPGGSLPPSSRCHARPPPEDVFGQPRDQPAGAGRRRPA